MILLLLKSKHNEAILRVTLINAKQQQQRQLSAIILRTTKQKYCRIGTFFISRVYSGQYNESKKPKVIKVARVVNLKLVFTD